MAWASISHGTGTPHLEAQFDTREVVAFHMTSAHAVAILFKSGTAITLAGRDTADANRIFTEIARGFP